MNELTVKVSWKTINNGIKTAIYSNIDTMHFNINNFKLITDECVIFEANPKNLLEFKILSIKDD